VSAAIFNAVETQTLIKVTVGEEGLGVVSFNRPRELNAWSPDFMEELAAALQSLSAAGVRVALIRGEGRAFSAGGDIAMFATPLSSAEHGRVARALKSIYHTMLTDDVVYIAAIHGHCVGSALVFASCCDFRVCDETARFLLPEINMGMLPGIGIGWVGRTIPDGLLRRLLFTGEPVAAADPACADYVTQRVPAGQAEEQALALARSLLLKPAQALAYSKRLANRMRGDVDEVFLEYERLLNEQLLVTEEVKTRAQTFLTMRNSRR